MYLLNEDEYLQLPLQHQLGFETLTSLKNESLDMVGYVKIEGTCLNLCNYLYLWS